MLSKVTAGSSSRQDHALEEINVPGNMTHLKQASEKVDLLRLKEKEKGKERDLKALEALTRLKAKVKEVNRHREKKMLRYADFSYKENALRTRNVIITIRLYVVSTKWESATMAQNVNIIT